MRECKHEFLCRISLLLLLVLGGNFHVMACKYTIRDIGFSVIAQTRYSVIIADHKSNWTDSMLAELRKYNKLGNVHAVFLI